MNKIKIIIISSIIFLLTSIAYGDNSQKQDKFLEKEKKNVSIEIYTIPRFPGPRRTYIIEPYKPLLYSPFIIVYPKPQPSNINIFISPSRSDIRINVRPFFSYIVK